MRTKTLLAAAILAAGLATSMAADVYSQNVVGYMNVSLANGYTIIANQLDLDGTGTNNTVNTVFSNSLPSVTVYAYNGATYDTAAYSTKSGWGGNVSAVNAALNGGNGVFVKVLAATNLTLVGNVLQGTLTKTSPAGYNLIGSRVPQAGLIQDNLGFVPSGSDAIYQYKADQSGYLTAAYATKTGWSPSQPSIAVGEGFWLKTTTGNTWTRNFTVQ